MRFKAMLNGQEIEGDCVNPGEWFGKAWIVEVGCGFSSIFFAVEGDGPQDVIDNLCDSEEYGHLIRVDEDTAKEAEEDGLELNYAGNASEPVDLENVHIHGEYVNRMTDAMPVPSMKYLVGEMTPIEYANR